MTILSSVNSAMDESLKYIKLNEQEKSYIYSMFSSVSTITFFNGDPPINYIRTKISQIILANPWLTGRLKKVKGEMHLVYNPLINNIHYISHFAITENKVLNVTDDIQTMSEKVKHLFVKKGIECLNKDEILFKVSLVYISDLKYALVCSMSHIIGDGNTFYNIYGMLSRKNEARSLIVERFDNYETKVEAELFGGNDESSRYMFSAGILLGSIKNLLTSKKSKLSTYIVDNKWIEKQKQIHNEGSLSSDNDDGSKIFISSNDILTSWAFKKSQCDVGFMPVNSRGRLEGLTSDHAGNYLAMMCYRKIDFEDPILIRKSLSTPLKRVHSKKLPSFRKTFLNTRLALCTNWSTLYQNIELDNCNQIFHCPCIADINNDSSTVFFIFKLNNNQIGILTNLSLKNSDEDTECIDLLVTY